MESDNKNAMFTRREFFSYFVPFLSIPFLLWWMFTGRKGSRQAAKGKRISIVGDIPAGISFQQGVILIREEESLKAFEARCTHLGCSINKTEGETLVCRCHGSRFSKDGNTISGPAIEPLKALEISKGIDAGTYIIQSR